MDSYQIYCRNKVIDGHFHKAQTSYLLHADMRVLGNLMRQCVIWKKKKKGVKIKRNSFFL